MRLKLSPLSTWMSQIYAYLPIVLSIQPSTDRPRPRRLLHGVRLSVYPLAPNEEMRCHVGLNDSGSPRWFRIWGHEHEASLSTLAWGDRIIQSLITVLVHLSKHVSVPEVYMMNRIWRENGNSELCVPIK